MNKQQNIEDTLVRCRSCGTLQTFSLWKGKTEKKIKNSNCCCECGKRSYKYEIFRGGSMTQKTKEEELKWEIERKITEYELIEKVKQELIKEHYGGIVRTCDAIDFQIFVKKALQIGFQQGKAEGYHEGIKQKADVMKKEWQEEARKQVFCSKCGFPKEWERNPVFIADDIFSLMHAEDNICEECGHQADGYTIKKLEPLLQKYLGFGKRQVKKEFEKIINDFKGHEYTDHEIWHGIKQELKSKLKQGEK